MDNRSLILLGLLMAQNQHGYQINEFIETNLSTMTNMKKPTAYALLDKLSKQGYIDVQQEQEGNRPPRKVYSINEKGIECFYQLLIENLSSTESIFFDGDIGLMFLDNLPIKKVIPALRKRMDESQNLLKGLIKTPSHGNGIGVNLAIEHKKIMVQADIQFLQNSLQILKMKSIGE